MPLPSPLEALWKQLESVRAEVLAEVEGLSQTQSEWRPDADDWSVGEILHHLTLAEVATGKLTTKLLKEPAGGAVLSFPADLTAFAPLPDWPPGPREAPPVVRPALGQPIAHLVEAMRAARERSAQSIERVAAVDPQAFRFAHFRLGELDLAQWWMLQTRHDADHLEQLRRLKASPGFPPA